MTLHEDVEKEFKSFLQMIENLIFAGELDRDKVNTSLMFLFSAHIGLVTAKKLEQDKNWQSLQGELDAKHEG